MNNVSNERPQINFIDEKEKEYDIVQEATTTKRMQGRESEAGWLIGWLIGWLAD